MSKTTILKVYLDILREVVDGEIRGGIFKETAGRGEFVFNS